jgi:hypothetical protein
MLRLDVTTRVAMNQAVTASAKAQAVIDSMLAPITCKVYNGSGTLMGSGTMGTPWATRTNNVLTIGNVASFAPTTNGTPDADWYIQFEDSRATPRFVRGSFGLTGSGQDFVWSLGTWSTLQLGQIGVASAFAFKGTAEADLVDLYVLADGTVTFGWISEASKALGTYTNGVAHTYNTKWNDANVPSGTIARFAIVSTPIIGVTIDPISGILQFAPTVAAGNYTITVSIINIA